MKTGGGGLGAGSISSGWIGRCGTIDSWDTEGERGGEKGTIDSWDTEGEREDEKGTIDSWDTEGERGGVK